MHLEDEYEFQKSVNILKNDRHIFTIYETPLIVKKYLKSEAL